MAANTWYFTGLRPTPNDLLLDLLHTLSSITLHTVKISRTWLILALNIRILHLLIHHVRVTLGVGLLRDLWHLGAVIDKLINVSIFILEWVP